MPTISDAINSLTNKIPFKSISNTTQNWECEVADFHQIGEFIFYYKTLNLSELEKFVLMRVIIESFNDLVCNTSDWQCYWDEIMQLLKTDYKIHEKTIEYWACDNEELDDCFAITQIIRSNF